MIKYKKEKEKEKEMEQTTSRESFKIKIHTAHDTMDFKNSEECESNRYRGRKIEREICKHLGVDRIILGLLWVVLSEHEICLINFYTFLCNLGSLFRKKTQLRWRGLVVRVIHNALRYCCLFRILFLPFYFLLLFFVIQLRYYNK